AAAMQTQPVLTYLANTIRTSGGREVPYSLVTAVDLRAIAVDVAVAAGSASPPIVLNDWTARDLAARVGDPLTLEYYTWEEPGRQARDRQPARAIAILRISAPQSIRSPSDCRCATFAAMASPPRAEPRTSASTSPTSASSSSSRR